MYLESLAHGLKIKKNYSWLNYHGPFIFSNNLSKSSLVAVFKFVRAGFSISNTFFSNPSTIAAAHLSALIPLFIVPILFLCSIFNSEITMGGNTSKTPMLVSANCNLRHFVNTCTPALVAQ